MPREWLATHPIYPHRKQRALTQQCRTRPHSRSQVHLPVNFSSVESRQRWMVGSRWLSKLDILTTPTTSASRSSPMTALTATMCPCSQHRDGSDHLADRLLLVPLVAMPRMIPTTISSSLAKPSARNVPSLSRSSRTQS